ncbi:40S ribosomal protein S27-like [Suricata suricatta]|uniref:40S ribosomal protein S27-like n=1 Tax=Suricata suricatta TaxID=37032 RepID=UPI00115536E7|nr:40S ribosomal protein S27-like [Suricata suricatta]
MPLEKDLLHPSPEEKRKRKKKQPVQNLDSYFMARKCPGYYEITTIFSHAQMVVCMLTLPTVRCQPTEGKVTEGYSFGQKQHLKHPESRRVGNHPNKHILDTHTYTKEIV